MAETDSSGNWTNYVFFGGERLARNVSGDIKYYITDHLHSTAMFVDKAGTTAAILDDNDFYPWGGVVPGVGKTTSNNHYKMTGKERDTESGLDYYGARYYGSGMGRFMSPDWAAKPATVPYAEFGDPQSLNLYSYTRNSPIIRVDGDGHDANGMLARPGQGGILGTSGGLSDGDNPYADADRVMWANAAGAIFIVSDPAQQQQQQQQAQNNGQTQNQQTASSDKPSDSRKNVVDLLRAKNGCSDWFNTGTGSAADTMSNVRITLFDPKGPIPGPDAVTSEDPHAPIEVNSKGRFYANSDNQLPVGDKYKPGSTGAREVILLHELAHKMQLIPHDSLDVRQSEKNTQTVIDHCAGAIGP
jgi:RHS repeat-associated protein